MQSGNVYITIGLDKKGNVQEVRVNGEVVRPYEGKPGLLPEEGGTTPGCEQVVKKLVHELLTCKKKGDKPTSDPGGGKPGDPGPGSDPCCYRDPGTGRVWCWC